MKWRNLVAKIGRGLMRGFQKYSESLSADGLSDEAIKAWNSLATTSDVAGKARRALDTFAFSDSGKPLYDTLRPIAERLDLFTGESWAINGTFERNIRELEKIPEAERQERRRVIEEDFVKASENAARGLQETLEFYSELISRVESTKQFRSETDKLLGELRKGQLDLGSTGDHRLLGMDDKGHFRG